VCIPVEPNKFVVTTIVSLGQRAILATTAVTKFLVVISTQELPNGNSITPRVVVRAVPPPAVDAALRSVNSAAIDFDNTLCIKG